MEAKGADAAAAGSSAFQSSSEDFAGTEAEATGLLASKRTTRTTVHS